MLADDTTDTTLEFYFSSFRKHIIGINQTFISPFGRKKIVYADWAATGRAYQPIENFIQKKVLPYIANTHTESTVTSTCMSKAYEEAKTVIKRHAGANEDDVLLFCGNGMTAAVNKLQRLLGLRVPERLKNYINDDQWTLYFDEALKPVVFVSHMEHHSNHISWLETIADVEIINPDEKGNISLTHLTNLLQLYQHRKHKIAAVTACSNVTGIQTPFHTIAKLMHKHNGLCFVDFAGSAPYVHINMHPEKGAELDAIYFSPHKFLGGAGTPGVLIFNKKIYSNAVPDQPGGGTVTYTNPWQHREYISDIEQREDGGTPPFLGAIRTAMCIRLKEKMTVEKMLKREEELLQIIFEKLQRIQNITILEAEYTNRLSIVSFLIQDVPYNLIVKILNDRFGIQTRGGCSCAGTYGHLLLSVDKKRSHTILHQIRSGNLSAKPGWVRLSVHPTTSNAEIDFILESIALVAKHITEWMNDYEYDAATNEYSFIKKFSKRSMMISR